MAEVYELFTCPVKSYRVVDGDTVKCVLDLGYAVFHETSVRIIGIDTPEARGKEKIAGLPVKELLTRWLAGHTLLVRSDKWGKYAKRTLGDVFWEDVDGGKHYVSEFILEHELGKPYHGEKRTDFDGMELALIAEQCQEVAQELGLVI